MTDEAYKCEEKEEKLVKDAVQHLTQANMQIKDLHHQFTHKVSSFGSTSTLSMSSHHSFYSKSKRNLITICLCLDTLIIHHILHQVDESSRQREEINGLLSQVCDLQNRVQKYSHENDDLTANLRVYQVTLQTSYQSCWLRIPPCKSSSMLMKNLNNSQATGWTV